PARRPGLARSSPAPPAPKAPVPSASSRDAGFPAAGGDRVAVPVRAVLPGALTGGVVDVDEAEALGVAVGPFEVVQQRPREVPADVGARLDGPFHGGDVVAQVRDAPLVADAAVAVHRVVERGAVLGD